jgi:aminoglycoside 6-adenylyltransferase
MFEPLSICHFYVEPRQQPNGALRIMESTLESLLERIKQWAISDDDVVALIMTGSGARDDGRIDEHSDLDLEVIADRPDRLAGDSTWLKQFGKVMLSQSLTQDQGYPTRLVFYEGGNKVDFTLADTKRLTDMVQVRKLDGLYDRGYRVIVDKRGITKSLPGASGRFPIVTRPTQAEFTAVVEEFWFEAAHIPRYLLRNELWVVKFRDWTMKGNLLKLLQWHAIATSSTPTDVWYIGIHMKDWLEPEIWRECHDVFAHFDAKDSWRGLIATINLFRRVATETADRAGLDYPTRVDRDATDYIRDFESHL